MDKYKLVLFLVILKFIITNSYSQLSYKQKFELDTKKYIGIEVGSKGVKMSCITLGNKKTNTPYVILKDTNVNTNFVDLTNETFNATLNVMESFYNIALNDFKVNPKEIYVVISSGVKNQAIKLGKIDFVNKLIDSFKLKIYEPNRKIEIVDVLVEAKMAHLGVISNENRFNTFLIDIGSGNSKGVYFIDNNIKKYKLFQLNWGTKNTTNAVEAILNGDTITNNFISNIKYIIDGPVTKELELGINKTNIFNTTKTVCFNGGIPWSIATLIKPEYNDSIIIKVTYAEINAFYKKLETNFNSVLPDFLVKKLEKYSLNKDFLKFELTRVHEVFNRKSIMTGTKLLLKIMRQFKNPNEEKIFLLIKNTQAAWISAYVNEKNDK